jgi:hypothetical protein
MVLLHRTLLGSALAVVVALIIAGNAAAQRIGQGSSTADNLMVVLREWKGGNKPDEALKPTGKVWANFQGEVIVMELAWYEFLGDMQIRFVFDEPHSFRNATAEEFARLHLSPEEAVERALANIKRVYGEPQLVPWVGGLTQIMSQSQDLDSSFLLDRALWRNLLARHPGGLVAAVPNRGGLAFAPLADSASVALLRRDVGHLYRSSDKLRVSSALYLFKDDSWTVFQPPGRTP